LALRAVCLRRGYLTDKDIRFFFPKSRLPKANLYISWMQVAGQLAKGVTTWALDDFHQ